MAKETKKYFSAVTPTPGSGEAFKKLFEKKETYTIDAEIFASGKWNGMLFKAEDLKDIVEAFEKLKELHKVPLKFGHNDDQPMTDGQPALGWVDQIWTKTVDGIEKLFARFTDVPKIVYDAMKSKRYRNVSIELDFDVVHMTTHYPFVLSGVALLGADIPAVNVLADLTAYLDRDHPLVYSRREVFTADPKTNHREGNTMEIDQKEYERLKKLEQDAEKFERQAKDEKAKREEFERKEQERIDNERKEKIRVNRDKFTKMIDQAVTDMTITPAQKEVFTKVLKIDDDEAVLNLNSEDVEALIGTPDKDKGSKFSQDRAAGGGASLSDDNHDDLEGKTPGEKLDFAARRLRGKDPKLSYNRALESAMNAYPDLAREHINATVNGEEA